MIVDEGAAVSLRSALAQNREFTRAIIDSFAAHIAVIDQFGCIQLTNRSWDRFAAENQGVPEHTSAGVNYLDICRRAAAAGDAVASEVLVGLEAVLAGAGTTFQFEYPCHSDDVQRWFLLQATALEHFGGGVLLHIDITQRKLLEGKLVEHERLQTLAAGLIKGQEDERTRIARELHDCLNQHVAALAIELGILAKQIPEGNTAVEAKLRVLQESAFGLSEVVRRISHELHPASLEYHGLVPALEVFCREFSERTALPVRFAVEGEIQPTPPAATLCLYRVAQQAVMNAYQHAGAASVRVELCGHPGAAHLLVSDNGRGFDRAAVTSGLGLTVMEERVRALGGTIEIESEPGLGTAVRVELPLRGVA